MESKYLYSIIVVILAVLVLADMYRRNPKQFKLDIKSPKNSGWVVGVVLFTLLLTAPVLVFAKEKKGDWLAYTQIYIGLDSTFKQSPQCRGGSYSDRITSNGGFKQNIYRSFDKRMHFNAKYTHHSCAQNDDRNSYDAFGVELVYTFNHK